MPRSPRPPATLPTLPPVRVIPADALMRLDELRAVLGLPLTCLRREARLCRLRVSRRSGRYWTTGRWIAEWIESGEVRPRVRPGPCDLETPAAGT
jgi:hypothetical protein